MHRGVAATSSQLPSSNLRLTLHLTSFASSPPHPSPRRPTPRIPSPLPASPLPQRSHLTLSTARRFISNPSFHRWTSSKPSGRVAFSSGQSGEQDREILVQHLLVGKDDLKLLVELLKRHSQGEDLSDLAAKFSLCPSKENGGMLGWVQRGQLVPEFEEAAFSAPLNKIVRCKTEHGWHLLQVLSERVIQDIGPEEFHLKMVDPSFFDEAQLIDVREPDEVLCSGFSQSLELVKTRSQVCEEASAAANQRLGVAVKCLRPNILYQVLSWINFLFEIYLVREPNTPSGSWNAPLRI